MGAGQRDREVDITRNQSEEESWDTSSQQHLSKCLRAYLKILRGFSSGLGVISCLQELGDMRTFLYFTVFNTEHFESSEKFVILKSLHL